MPAGTLHRGRRNGRLELGYAVFLYTRMPNLDGLLVLGNLRVESGLSDLPILVLTAPAQESHTREAFESGATDYLTKRFTIPS